MTQERSFRLAFDKPAKVGSVTTQGSVHTKSHIKGIGRHTYIHVSVGISVLLVAAVVVVS